MTRARDVANIDGILTTKGDIYAATAAATPSRLGVGSNGETIVADSSTATGLKWTTQGQGATLISRVDFSNVASQAFNSVFSTTYQTYLISIEKIYAGTFNDDLLLQFTYSAGSGITTTGYYGASFGYNFSGSLSVANINNGSSGTIMQTTGTVNGKGRAQLFVTGVGITAGDRPVISGTAYNTEDAAVLNVGYQTNAAGNYDGFLLKSSSSNIYGTVAVYGLAK